MKKGWKRIEEERKRRDRMEWEVGDQMRCVGDILIWTKGGSSDCV